MSLVCFHRPTNVPYLQKDSSYLSCTLARATFVSGLYSIVTRAAKNNLKTNDDIVTWADIIRKNGVFANYVGTLHLDESKLGWRATTNKNEFGFTDRRYLLNRRSLKGIKVDSEGNKETCCDLINEYTKQTLTEFLDDDKDNYFI